MTLFDDRFNHALEIFQEFGPRRRIPVQERWREAFPEAAARDFVEWERAFREIEAFAYDLAVQVRDQGLGESAAVRRIAEQFPRMSRERVMKTFSQARYFAMMGRRKGLEPIKYGRLVRGVDSRLMKKLDGVAVI